MAPLVASLMKRLSTYRWSKAGREGSLRQLSRQHTGGAVSVASPLERKLLTRLSTYRAGEGYLRKLSLEHLGGAVSAHSPLERKLLKSLRAYHQKYGRGARARAGPIKINLTDKEKKRIELEHTLAIARSPFPTAKSYREWGAEEDDRQDVGVVASGRDLEDFSKDDVVDGGEHSIERGRPREAGRSSRCATMRLLWLVALWLLAVGRSRLSAHHPRAALLRVLLLRRAQLLQQHAQQAVAGGWVCHGRHHDVHHAAQWPREHACQRDECQLECNVSR